MCIIFVAHTKRPVDDILIRADDRNDDGIGIAWRSKGKVLWEKGLNIDQLLERLHNDPPPFPYVMEFRSATVGGDDLTLCHPFVVSPLASTALKGSAKEVLFHNGHWAGWEFRTREALLAAGKKIPSGAWSDSRALAYLVGVYGKGVLDWLDLKNEQRICLFSYNGLSMIGSWSEADGFSHSNPTHGWMGQINITPKKEYHKTLSKKEKKALEKEEAKSDSTRKLLAAAKDHLIGHCHSHSGGYWPGFDDEEEKKPIPSWEGKVEGEEELPPVEVKPDRYWELEEIGEMLCELRLFNWRNFQLIRTRQPLRAS